MRRAAAALLLVAATAASAQDGLVVGVSVGVMHRQLRERAAGATLLTERGTVATAGVQATRTWAGGAAWQGEARIAGGRLDYDGQTQGGAPLAARSGHMDWTADVRWRPLAPAAWGEAWLTAGTLWNRRDISSTPQASGLRETSHSLLLGVRWGSPMLAGPAGWQLQGLADVRGSVWHRLDVDFHGLLDTARLRGARQVDAGLRLVGTRVDSPWSWELTWRRLAQPQSEVTPLYRNAAVFGTVRQPALRVEDLGFALSRRF